MSQPARFPYLPVVSKRGEAVPMPMLPLELRLGDGLPVRAQGLLDSGATVNVLPFSLGLRLGAVWENQKTAVTLAFPRCWARLLPMQDAVTMFNPPAA
jgi:hypothetical protein